MTSWKRMRAGTVIGTALMAVSCGKHEFEPPDRGERVGEAEGVYSPAIFDTVAWASPEERSLGGNEIYAAKCRQCHGTLGLGGTEYALERGLDVPSLVRPDWPYAASLDSVRHRIFVGHPDGMPTFGIAGISPREIDGAAYYILFSLRLDVLGADAEP